MANGETQLTPAHLLLAITQDGSCSASHALVHLGVKMDKLRQAIYDNIPPIGPDGNPEFHMSAMGKQSLNDALYIARTMGDGTILTLHILMGIFSQSDVSPYQNALVRPGQIVATPPEVLRSQGVTRERLWHVASEMHRGLGPGGVNE